MKTLHLLIIAVAVVMIVFSVNSVLAQNAADLTNLMPQQQNKAPFENFTTDGQVNSIATSSNDKYVVAGTQSGNDKGSVYYFDKNGTLLWNYTSDRQILSVAASSDGSYVVAGGGQFYAIGTYGPAGNDNGMVYFFDGKGNLLWKYDTNRPYVMSVAVSSDGSYVAVGTETDILYFDKQGKLLWSYSVPQTNIHPVAISPDGSYVATKDEATVELFDKQGKLLWNHTAGHGTQEDTSAGSLYLTMSSDGRYVITSDYSDGILVFDDSGNIVLARSTGTHLFYESISSNGSFIAASAQQWGQSDPGGLYLYTKDGTLLWHYSDSAINTISADGSHVLAGIDGYQGPTLFFFDRQGNLLWNNMAGGIHAVSLSSNGNLAVAGASSEQYGTSSLSFFNNNTTAIIPNQNPPVIVSQVELDSAFAFFPDNQTCYDKRGFSNAYTCSTSIVPGHKVQCAYFLGASYCEPIHQRTSGTNLNCIDPSIPVGTPQWFDMYNTQNNTLQIQLYDVSAYKGVHNPWGQEGLRPTTITLEPYQKCTYGFNPVDEPLSLDQTNMSIAISYTYNGKNYTVSSPPLTDISNDSRTWQFDGNNWVFGEQNTVTVPEFPFTIPVLLVSITSLIVFMRMRK